MGIVVNNNVQSLNAQHNLARSGQALGRSLERLSSGMRVNRGADGPAALVISEKQRAQIAGLNTAVANAEKAVSLVQTAEGALTEMNSLLVKVRSLALDSANAGVNDTETLAANQSEIDEALASINRIASNTQFGSTKLLDGSLSSGKVLNAGVAAFSQSSLAAGNYGVNFAGAWAKASLSDSMSDVEAAALTNATDSDTLTAASTFTNNGTMAVVDGSSNTIASVNFTAGDSVNATMATFQTAIDNANVGVTATFTPGVAATSDAEFGFTADDFGNYADGYEIQIADGTTTYDTSSTGATAATTQTLAGTLVTNAGAMSQTGNRGNTFTNAAGTVSITLTDSAMTTPINAANAVEAATGAVFQIGANQNQTASVNIGAMNASSIGRVSGDTLASLMTGGARTVTAGQAQSAIAIIDQAINDVSSLRGNLGAFQANTLESTANNLRTTLENTVAAESVIRDTDFASEISSFTKNQILQQAGISVLSNANQLPQMALSLLG